MTSQLDRFLMRLKNVEREVRAAKTPQLADSSVEDGAIAVNDQDGNTTMQIGLQYDGTSAPAVLTGPVPPSPTSPTVLSDNYGLTIIWDGTFVDGAVAPQDWAGVDIVIGPIGMDPIATPPKQRFTSPRGGQVFLALPEGSYDVVLVSRTLAGKPSLPSGVTWGIASDPATFQSDGVVPAAPSGVVATGSLSSVFVRWDAVTLNAASGQQVDPVTYRLHCSSDSAFTPSDATLLNTTSGRMASTSLTPSGDKMTYDTIYYFAVEAVDADGISAPSEIVPGQMNQAGTDDIATGSVTADKMYAVLSLVSTLTTRSQDEVTGALFGTGTDIDPDGFFSYDSSGELRFQLPNDSSLPAVLRGDAEVEHLSVKALASLVDTSLEQAKTFRLETSVSDPSSPPVITVSNAVRQFSNVARTDWADRNGWAFDGTYFYTIDEGNGVLEKWNLSGSRVLARNLAHTRGAGSVVILSGFLYMLTRQTDTNRWQITQFDPETMIPIGDDRQWNGGAATPKAVIGADADANCLIIMQANASGYVFADRYIWGATALQSAGARWQSKFWYPYALSTAMYGTFDFGTPRYIVKTNGTGDTLWQVLDPAGNVGPGDQYKDLGLSWDINMPAGPVGLVWNGTQFVGMDRGGLLRFYEPGNTWTTIDGTPSDLGDSNETFARQRWSAAYTFRDADGSQPETLRSPVATFTMKKRARVNISTARLPAAVEEARIYLKRGVPSPAPSMTLQGSASGDQPSLMVTNAVFSPANDPTSSGFTGSGTPAKIVSTESASSPRWNIAGDGSGRAGPLQWDANGVMLNGSAGTKVLSGTKTPDSSGRISFAHGLGVIPKMGTGSVPGNSAMVVQFNGNLTDATNIGFVVRNLSDGSVVTTSQSVTVVAFY